MRRGEQKLVNYLRGAVSQICPPEDGPWTDPTHLPVDPVDRAGSLPGGSPRGARSDHVAKPLYSDGRTAIIYLIYLFFINHRETLIDYFKAGETSPDAVTA
jgi:hypothetical protein